MEEKKTIEQVFSMNSLKKAWHKIKGQFSKELLRDPIDHIAYEANIDHNLSYLSYRVREEKFTPSNLTIIRAAKNNGLTRPLAFLDIEDQITLKVICDSIEERLLKDFPPYVNYGGRSQSLKKSAIENDAQSQWDYETWFDRWMRHQTIINRFLASESDYGFLVKTDITNFFPTINLDILRKVVLGKADTDETIVNLLFYILYDMIPHPYYATEHKLGLPQENYDASRMLAHSYLKPVDDFFSDMGNQGRYVRWVDDIAFAAVDENEARKHLYNLQLALEKIGLNINSAKTKIVTKEKARDELFPEMNSYLEKVHEDTSNGQADLTEFEQTLRYFMEQNQKTVNWERILRRFYTQSRRINSSLLEKYSWQHIIEYPGSTQKILDYMESRPYSIEIENELWSYLSSGANLYEDIEIQIFEYMLGWRISLDRKEAIAKSALDYFFSRNQFVNAPKPRDYTKGLISLLIYKTGGYDELLQIKDFFTKASELHFIRYAYVILMATEYFRADAQKKAMKQEDMVLRRLSSFVEDIISAPSQHLKLLKNYIKPTQKKLPDKYFLNSRALPIIKILSFNTQFRAEQWIRMIEDTINLLKNRTDDAQRDVVMIEFLEREKRRS